MSPTGNHYHKHLNKSRVMEINVKIMRFAERMQKELNANAHKGDWNTWRNIMEILNDLEYHKAKLMIALKKDDSHEEVKELIADCANILMFLGNAGNLYEQD